MKKSQLLNFFRLTLLLLIFSAFSTSALAATITGGTKLYLKPNSNWSQADARFAVYLFTDGGDAKWYSMSDGDADGIYSTEVQAGESYEKLIFCRMNPSSGNNDWGNRWNSTCDLTYDGTNNYYNMSSSTNWGKGNDDNDCEDLTNDNKWSVYSSGGSGGDTNDTYYVRYSTSNNNNPNDGSYVWSDPQETVDGKFTLVVSNLSKGNNYFYIGTSKNTSTLLNKNINFENNATSKVSSCNTQNFNIGSQTVKGAIISCASANTTLVLTFDFTSGTDIKITIAGEMSIVTSIDPPYYIKDNITLTAKGGFGGNGDYKWYKKPHDGTYSEIPGETGSSITITVDGSYTYKVVDTTMGLEATFDIKPSVKCDDENTKVIFYEDFGWFKDQTDRAKSEYAKYKEKLGCTNIKEGGEYAIVAVPAWGGCSVKNSDGSFKEDYGNPCFCPVNDEENYPYVDMWFNKKLDHATEEKYIQSLKSGNDKITDSEINAELVKFRKNFETGTDEFREQHTAAPEVEKNKNNYYGGMLLFNCKGGDNDVLYEREINVCENTYINFSAWFSKANVSNKDKIGAKFVLLKGSTRTELDSYVIENIDVDAGWKQISAMFNSKDCDGKVIVQLINYAPAGNEGNDLLVDDVKFSICTPEASLYADLEGEKVVSVDGFCGEEIELISEIDNLVFSSNPYYWWQKKDSEGKWVGLTAEPIQGRSTYKVTSTSSLEEYRVVVANTAGAASAGGNDTSTGDICGMYSVTNSVKVKCSEVELSLVVTKPSAEPYNICVGSEGAYKLTLTNPFDYPLYDLKVNITTPLNLAKDYKITLSDPDPTKTTYADGVWDISEIQAHKSVTLTYAATATQTGDAIMSAYVSKVGDKLYEANPIDATIKISSITFTTQPKNKSNVCEGYSAKFTAEATSTCDGDVTYQWVRRIKESASEFEVITGETNSSYEIPALKDDDLKYEYAVLANVVGCPCTNVPSDVATIEYMPKTDVPTETEIEDYLECKTSSSDKQDLKELVKVDNKDKLVFYKSPTGLETEIEFDKSISIDTKYYFTYQETGKCPSNRGVLEVKVLETPVATITSEEKQEYCTAEDTKTFTVIATSENGTGKWEITKVVNDKGAVLDNSEVSIDDDTSETTTVTLPKGTEATITWRVSNEKCDATDKTTLIAYEKPSIVFKTNKGSQAACATSEFTVAVEEHPGTGLWEFVGDKGDAVIKNTTDFETKVSGIELGKQVTLRYTAKNGECDPLESTDITLENQICNNLVLTNFATKKVVCENDTLHFKINITNYSTVESEDVMAEVKLPKGLEYVKKIDETGSYDPKSGIWNVGDIGVEEGSNVATLKINVKATETSTLTAEIVKASTKPLSIKADATVTVNPLPTAKFSSSSSPFCTNNIEQPVLDVEFTGEKPYILTYKFDDKEEKPNINSDKYSISHVLNENKDYKFELIEVTDGNGCKATLDGSATVTVNSKPTISFGTDGNLPTTICAGNPYTLPTVTVKENGSTIDIESEGWYLGATKISLGEGKYSYSGGTKITLDQGKYTFSIKDKDKSLVYKAKNGCGETFKEFRPKLDVNDCSNFTITYSLDKKQVCKGDEVVLTATITNNSDSELRDVILSQSWDGSQIASKDAAGTNKKIFVTSGDVASVYDEVNNLWKIETFTAHKSATLKITFSAQADESFHIYMKESNDVTYQDDAENPTPGDATLDVLEISDPVVLDATKNYNGICPETSSKTVNLSDLVTRNATDTLHFYDKDKILLTAEPTFDISTEIPSTKYYINRTEAGKCISNNPIPVTIEVYKPVTASIAATKNTICSGTESDVNITVDGDNPDFTIVYNNGVKDITKTISGTTLNIADELSSTTTYKLISVTDAHECEAKLDGTESVTITVNALPELVSFDIEDSDKIICDGESTKLKATFTGKAPFKFYINDVETESEDAEWSMDITEGKTYAIKQLSDDNCDSKLTQKDVTLTVESSPVVELDATNVTLNCNNPKATITASGANSYNWSYTDQDGVEQTQTGDILNVQLSESGQVNSSTTYTVYGYSEKAKCKSASPVTVTVTENKRTPVVSDLVSVNSQDETIEGYKETQIINCKDTELFIKSTIVDNVAAGYSPDDLTYDWAISEDGDLYEAYGVGETISTKTQGIFRLIVTDNETGCSSAAKRIEITENKTTPVITVVESVTTKDPSASEAVKTSVLTCEYPVLYLTPTIESENEVSYLWNNESTEDYLEVSEAGTYTLVVTDNVSFCSTEEYTYIVTQDNTAPTFNVDATYYLCPSDVVTEKTLSSLLPATPGVTYKFYNEAGEEIKDLYEISADASVTEYYVAGISDNGCESTKTMFSVDFARNVDFTLTTSQTSMMIGGNETVVTVVPDANSDIADTYTWLANGNELPADGLEYSTNLYLDTKFEVTATNRCDSKSQEAFVEVLWPTAFTPHNANGKNDDFAKGMHIIVFNRFYTKIFEGPDGWDGTINGTMNESESIAVPGVYYYSVQLPNGEVKKGTIEIVR